MKAGSDSRRQLAQAHSCSTRQLCLATAALPRSAALPPAGAPHRRLLVPGRQPRRQHGAQGKHCVGVGCLAFAGQAICHLERDMCWHCARCAGLMPLCLQIWNRNSVTGVVGLFNVQASWWLLLLAFGAAAGRFCLVLAELQRAEDDLCPTPLLRALCGDDKMSLRQATCIDKHFRHA